MLDIFSEEPQVKKKTTPITEEIGLGLLRGGVNFLEFGAMLGVGFSSSEEEGEDRTDVKNIITKGFTRKEDFYNIIQQDLEPLKQKLTPDPGSSSWAGKAFGALSELPLQLLAGPAGIVGSAQTQTSMELANAGVDAKTAIMLGAGAGVTTAVLIKIPAAGKTLGKTLGLISINPVTGTLQRAGTKAVLEESGYEKQAEMFDPFDPASIGIDLALGAFGGVLGHKQAKKNALKKSLPTEVVDAIDVIANQQKVRKATPFEPSIKSNTANQQAMEKALSDISEGKAVDVAEVFNETPDLKIRSTQFPEEIYTKKTVDNVIKSLEIETNLLHEMGKEKVIDTVDQAQIVKNMAEIKQPELNAIMESVIKENNLPEYLGHPKSVKSIVEKVLRKKSSEYNVYSIKDHTRGIIVLNDFQEVPKIIESLQAKAKIFSGEAAIDEPLNQFGYRGLHVVTDMKDGIKGEIQLHTKESLKIKDVTDEIYRKWRNLTDKDYTKLSSEDRINYESDMVKSQTLWNDFWSKIDPSVKASASSSVKGLESVTTPTVSSPSAGSLHTPSTNISRDLPDAIGLKSTTEPLSEPPLSKPKSDILTPPENIIAKTEGEKQQLKSFLNDPIEARVESFLQDKDISIITGTDTEGKSIYTNAREVIDEARLELKQIQDMQPLYMLAANCLRLGGE